jgi:kumamolisin
VVIGGQEQPIGGTSAVAPLYAGLLARVNQSLASGGGNPVGFVNPLLYSQAAPAGSFHDITSGNNDIYKALKGKFTAGPGWDPCTGLGSVDGAKLLASLSGQQAKKARA